MKSTKKLTILYILHIAYVIISQKGRGQITGYQELPYVYNNHSILTLQDHRTFTLGIYFAKLIAIFQSKYNGEGQAPGKEN